MVGRHLMCRTSVVSLTHILSHAPFLPKINDVAASNLRANSKSYLKNAKQLSWDAMMRKWAPVIAVVVVLLIVLLYIFYL